MTIDTSRLSETEAGSTIPPWPIDFGPAEPPPEVEQTPEGFAIAVMAVIGVIVGTAFVVNLIAKLL